MTEKRIDYPCPWCGTRCFKVDGGHRKWTCGSTQGHNGVTRHQSANCRNREIDAGTNDKAEIERLRAIVGKLPKTADGVPVVPGLTLHDPIWIDDPFVVHQLLVVCPNA